MELRITHLPYCVRRLNDGKYILLNRNYKPLGIQTNEWVIYEDHPSRVALKITPSIAKKISWDNNENIDTIFLYNDGCTPTSSDSNMNSYLKRLGFLAGLKSKTD